MSKAAQRKEKQRWAIEKPKLDNARKLRGIYVIDLDDKEFTDTMKNARKKLELPMEAAMPCELKNHQYWETCGGSDNRKSTHACIVEAHEPTRKRLERTLPKDHEDRIAGKGLYSLSIFCTSSFLCTKQCKYRMPKQPVGKEWKKLEKLPARQMTKVKRKREVIQEAQKEQRTVHFGTLMYICHLENAELEPKYKGRVVLRGDSVKDDSGSHAVLTEQGFVSITNDGPKSNGRSLHGYQDVQDKQPTQYLTPTSKWTTLQDH